MSTIHFRGHIDAVSHLTVSLPDAQGMPRLPNGAPYFPASSINGKIRHAAHKGVIHTRRAMGMPPLGLDASYYLAAGVDTGRAINTKPGAAEQIAGMLAVREANPLISLFGRWGLAGRLSVGDAVASGAEALRTIGNGVRRHPFVADASLVEFVAPDEIERLEQIIAADGNAAEDLGPLKDEEKKLKKAMRSMSAEEKPAANARLAEIEVAMRSVKDAREGAAEAIQRPLEPYESIVAGSRLQHHMSLHGASTRELGAMLWALQFLASEPFVGGHRRGGCGKIAAEWEVSRYDFGAPKPVTIGTVRFNDEGYLVDGSELHDARAAWDATIAEGLRAAEKVA